MNRYPTHSVCDHCSDITVLVDWVLSIKLLTYLCVFMQSLLHLYLSLSFALIQPHWLTGCKTPIYLPTYLLSLSFSPPPLSLSLPPSLPSSICLSISLSLPVSLSLSLSLSVSVSLSLSSAVSLFSLLLCFPIHAYALVV